jgi:ABC-2 type transport system permease protein
MRGASSEASAQGSKLLARYLEDHPELAAEGANKSDFYVVGIAVQDEVEKKMKPVLDQFDRQLANQQALLDRYRYLSPAIVTQSALNDLAGTSAHRYKHFLGLADRYHGEWRAWFNPRTIKAVKLTAADIGALPSFQFVEEPTQTVLVRALGSLAGLLVPVLFVMGLSAAALKRYRVVG